MLPSVAIEGFFLSSLHKTLEVTVAPCNFYSMFQKPLSILKCCIHLFLILSLLFLCVPINTSELFHNLFKGTMNCQIIYIHIIFVNTVLQSPCQLRFNTNKYRKPHFARSYTHLLMIKAKQFVRMELLSTEFLMK